MSQSHDTKLAATFIAAFRLSMLSSVLIAAIVTASGNKNVPFLSSVIDSGKVVARDLWLRVNPISRSPRFPEVPAYVIAHTEESRRAAFAKQTKNSDLTNTKAYAERMLTSLRHEEIFDVVKQSMLANVAVLAIDMTIAHAAIMEQIIKDLDAARSSNPNFSVALVLRQSIQVIEKGQKVEHKGAPGAAGPAKTNESKSDCISDPYPLTIELPSDDILTASGNFYFGHPEFRTLGGDDKVRAVCHLRRYYANVPGEARSIILPSLSLLAAALSPIESSTSTANTSAAADFQRLKCLVKGLASGAGLRAQLLGNEEAAYQQVVKDCSISPELLRNLDSPKWIDYSIRDCPRCEIESHRITEQNRREGRLQMPSNGIALYGRKDVFATDRLSTPTKTDLFGVDVHAHAISSFLNKLDRAAMLGTDSPIKESSSWVRKACYLLIWALLIATSRSVALVLAQATRDLVERLCKGIFVGKLEWQVVEKLESYWLVRFLFALIGNLAATAARFIVIFAGLALAIAIAFGIVFYELLNILGPYDYNGYLFAAVIIASFVFESVLAIAAGVEGFVGQLLGNEE